MWKQYYLSVPCVSCPMVSKVFKGQACLAAHCFSLSQHHLTSIHSLASIPLLLIPEDKGGPTHGHETKGQLCLMEAGSSGFTIFGKDVSGERKYIELRSKYQLFY